MAAAVDVSPERPILIDKFLENAIEAEADAISDGVDAFVPAVVEHIELAGIHSGDSACVIPPVSIPLKHIETICEYTRRIAVELKVVGLMNIQYAIMNDTVYILEANPRASRTVPLVSKVCNIPMAKIATRIMLGKMLSDEGLRPRNISHFGVKEAVFPFNMFPEYDDSYIRKAAIQFKIPYITTLAEAMAAARGIYAIQHGKARARSLQSYHSDIK